MWALMKAKFIPNYCVMLPSQLGRYTVVTSKTKIQKWYWMYNPREEWVACDCPHGMKGSMCKHQMKVLRMMHPNLVEGKITIYCGSMKGTASDGLQNMFGIVETGYNTIDNVTFVHDPKHVHANHPREPQTEQWRIPFPIICFNHWRISWQGSYLTTSHSGSFIHEMHQEERQEWDRSRIPTPKLGHARLCREQWQHDNDLEKEEEFPQLQIKLTTSTITDN